ncbi:MAG TPA: DNA ligase D, partial [Salinimicrobium sp.]|nr:DNA ligase D [Salinimicrobium sp.]
KKIKGEFALVKTKSGDEDKNYWLLIKKKDDFSTDLDYDAERFIGEKKEKAPKAEKIDLGKKIKPMLATKTDKIFNKPDWIYEIKCDGYRAVANIENGKVELYSRNGLSFKKKFSSIVKNLKTIEHDVILDGEVVAMNEEGSPSFQILQNVASIPQDKLVYYVFDMLYLNGYSMVDLPLLERKSLIQNVIEDIPQIEYCDHVEGMGTAFYEKAVSAGLEGVIAKQVDSKYYAGTRSDKWLKIKPIESQEALICGYTASDKGNLFSSLILGIFKKEKLVYIGNVGSGFNDKSQKEIVKKLKPLQTEKSPFGKKINLKGKEPTWVKPEIICEVEFTEWTSSGLMRHPVFKGLREDKSPTEIGKEKVTKAPKNKKTTAKKDNTLEIDGISVPISNLEKVYWPDSGYTKYDLIDYYLQISETILPYMIDRPQNLHRHPNGVKSEGFYQKDSGGILPHWIETQPIYSESNKANIEYMLCQKQATLIYMANLGCIELNPWNSRIQNLEYPDYTVIDIDPTDKNTFEEVIEVAQAAKVVLDKAKIKGFCKTSGSSGLHIYIPMGAKYTYDEVRDFTKILCYFIKEQLPELTSMERVVNKRKGKIYLDFLQNRKAQTLAAAYCARPKPGATVSAPLDWKEVKSGLDMHDFTIKTMPERIKEKKDLFKGVLGKGIDMQKALEKLGA